MFIQFPETMSFFLVYISLFGGRERYIYIPSMQSPKGHRDIRVGKVAALMGDKLQPGYHEMHHLLVVPYLSSRVIQHQYHSSKSHSHA